MENKYIYVRKHRLGKSNVHNCSHQSGIWHTESNFLPYQHSELNEAFKNLVSWCISGNIEVLIDAINNEETPIFGQLLQFKFECIDLITGHNIVEFAAISGHCGIMEILLQQRTFADYYLDVGKSFKYAMIQEDINMVRCMLEFSQKESISLGFDGYGTLDDFCWAIETNKIKIVETFLEYSKPEDVRATFHFTDVYYRPRNKGKMEMPVNALLLASKLGRTEIVRLLLTKGARPNTTGGKNKVSALHFAALFSQFETVKILIESGANISQEDARKRTPLDWARSAKRSAIDLKIIKFLSNQVDNLSIKLEPKNFENVEIKSEFQNSGETSEKNHENEKKTTFKRRSQDEFQYSEDPIDLVKPLVTNLLEKNFPSEEKVTFLTAIFNLITKNSKVCEYMAKKEIVEEITTLAEKVVNQPNNLTVIAQVLSKLNGFEKGKKIFDEIRMPIGVYEKLRTQMKIFEVSESPSDFAFTSDENTSKKIKVENIKVEPE